MELEENKTYYDDEGKNGKYIVNKLQLPEAQADPKVMEKYERYAKRVLWIDNNVVPGAFQLNASWYKKPNLYVLDEALQEGSNFLKPHKHDVGEIVAFFGSDPEDQENLNGEIIFYIDGEKHVITKSSLIFLPAGMEHGPLMIQKVDKPIFHFSCVMQDTYEAENTKDKE